MGGVASDYGFGNHTCMPGFADSKHYLTIKAQSPNGDSTWDVYISYERLGFIARQSKGAVMEAAHIVPEILARPSAIFEGLRRDEDEDKYGNGAMCYCGIPTVAYDKNGSPTQPWHDEVFMVFLNAECVAYNWYWHQCDCDLNNYPDGHVERFRRKIWP